MKVCDLSVSWIARIERWVCLYLFPATHPVAASAPCPCLSQSTELAMHMSAENGVQDACIPHEDRSTHVRPLIVSSESRPKSRPAPHICRPTRCIHFMPLVRTSYMPTSPHLCHNEVKCIAQKMRIYLTSRVPRRCAGGDQEIE